jgi:DNA polymerase-3 subunit chi
MTQVDFYVLEGASLEPDPAFVERFACRLIAKIWREGKTVHVHTADPRQAARLDDLLWTFQDVSFVPHALAETPPAMADPGLRIIIGHGDAAPTTASVLVDLDVKPPPFVGQFERVVEFVPGDEAGRALGRERYRYYQERGYPLASHPIRSET